MSKSSTRTPQAKDKLELYYSPVAVIAATGFFVWMVGWIVFWTFAGLVSGHFLAQLVGGVAVVFGVPLVLPFLPTIVHPWRYKGPVVTIDIDGISDVRKKCSFIPWSDIRRVTLGVGDTASILCFKFRRPDQRRADPPRLGLIGTLLKRMQFLGDWNVSLRLLACNRHETLKEAQRFCRRSIQRQVIELNKGNYEGGASRQ